MKNLLITFTVTLTAVAPLSTSIQTIYVNYKNHQSQSHSKNHHNSNNSDQTIYWYDSTININKDDNKPFGDNFQLSNSQNNDSSYFDNVFLKSLKLDNSTHKLTSSIVNLQNKDSVTDLSDSRADIDDYKTMQSLVSTKKDSKTAIQEGMAVLNRFYSMKAFNFNSKGYIASRNTFFSEYRPTTQLFTSSNDNLKQQMITPKKSSNGSLLGAKSKDMYLSFHWYGVSMNMDNKILTNPITKYINGISGFTNGILDGLDVPKMPKHNSNGTLNGLPQVPIENEIYNIVTEYLKDQAFDLGPVNAFTEESSFFDEELLPKVRQLISEKILDNTQVDDLTSWFKEIWVNSSRGWRPSPTVPKVPYYEEVNETGNDGNLAEADSEVNLMQDDLNDIQNVGENIESSIADIVGEGDAVEGAGDAAASEVVIDGTAADASACSIGSFIFVMVLTAITYIIIKALKEVYNTPFKSGSSSQTETIKNLLMNSNSNRLNTLNPLLINFKGSVNVNWLQKVDFTLTPNKPKTAPLAMITPGIPSPVIAKRYNMLTGKTNDFNLEMQPSTWNQFAEGILTNNLDINKFFIKHNISNPDILLTNSDWKKIIMQMSSISLNSQYTILLHIVDKKITFSNLNSKTNKTNIKYGDTPYSIQTIIGVSSKDTDILLNRVQLKSLANNFDYIKNHWNDSKIGNKVISGIKNNPINNPKKFKTPEEWFYNNDFSKIFWHCGLSQDDIIKFIIKLSKYYDSNSFDYIQGMAMRNSNNNILDISASMFK